MTQRTYIKLDKFEEIVPQLCAYDAILHELNISENGMVNKKHMERTYRRTCKKALLEKAAMQLKQEGKIEILKELGGFGRPAIYFRDMRLRSQQVMASIESRYTNPEPTQAPQAFKPWLNNTNN